MPTRMTGSCCCKAVQYEITAPIPMVVNCHCNICKKAGGGAFASLAVVKGSRFEVVSGKEELTVFDMGERVKRHFCRRCGTPIYNQNSSYPGRCMVSLGSFDEPSQLTPSVNIHSENRLAWVLLDERMKDFEQGYS